MWSIPKDVKLSWSEPGRPLTQSLLGRGPWPIRLGLSFLQAASTQGLVINKKGCGHMASLLGHMTKECGPYVFVLVDSAGACVLRAGVPTLPSR